MILKDAFSAYTLTPGQNLLLDVLDKFLSDDSPCLLLKGYAGTGKTFMMKGLTDFLAKTHRNFKLAAPTGRAAKVISQKTQHKAYTIHKTIYSSKDLKEFKIQNEDGTETFKFYFALKINDDPSNTVYIIDEASMLSDVYSESEFFRSGSGYLLRDLIKYIYFDHNNPCKKVIFIGDHAQLPPVGMNHSPALNKNYLRESCSLTAQEFELTEVVRQTKESGVLYYATKLRQSLQENIFNHLVFDKDYEDIQKISTEQLLSQYLQACHYRIDDETMVIAHSNALACQYNELIRKHFFPSQKEIAVGDKIMLIENNYNYQIELLNGDFGFVKSIKGEVENRTTVLKQINSKEETLESVVTIPYRDASIEFKDIEGKAHLINAKIIESLLYSEKQNISVDEQKAMYIDFWIRNPKLNQLKQLLHAKTTKHEKLQELVFNLSPNDISLSTFEKIKILQNEYLKNPTNRQIMEISARILIDALKSDPYFNALRIKFGYAVTCHKAQGGEWKNTFVNCKTSMGYFNQFYFRWLYTSITRAKENLFILNEPHFTMNSDIQPLKSEDTDVIKDIIVLDESLLELELSFDFPNESPFTKNIYFAIAEHLKDEAISIHEIRHTDYLEHYTFSQGRETVPLKIHYNKQGRITTIEKPTVINELAKEVYAKLSQLQHTRIVFRKENQEVIPKEFEFENDFLKAHYELRKKQISGTKLCITEIKHQAYQEVYTFECNGLKAIVRFYYNGQFRFTKYDIDTKQTTGLVDEIKELLKGDMYR